MTVGTESQAKKTQHAEKPMDKSAILKSHWEGSMFQYRETKVDYSSRECVYMQMFCFLILSLLSFLVPQTPPSVTTAGLILDLHTWMHH